MLKFGPRSVCEICIFCSASISPLVDYFLTGKAQEFLNKLLEFSYLLNFSLRELLLLLHVAHNIIAKNQTLLTFGTFSCFNDPTQKSHLIFYMKKLQLGKEYIYSIFIFNLIFLNEYNYRFTKKKLL
jgi:hypothetical protein